MCAFVSWRKNTHTTFILSLEDQGVLRLHWQLRRSPESRVEPIRAMRRSRGSTMLPFILFMSILCQGHAVDYGTEFVTAFPENLAYYFPAQPAFQLRITTFLPSTNVAITLNGANINQSTINLAQVYLVNIPNPEVFELGQTMKVVRVVSDKNISVLSISRRGDSTQSNVVPPTANLGTNYVVPSPNYTEFAVQLNNYNASVFTGSTDVPLDYNFRLIIINAEQVNNSITVTGKTPTGDDDTLITLTSFELIQFASDRLWFKVSSVGKVAVIITNPCIDTQNCRCNMVAHQLRPIEVLGTDFIFPPYNTTLTRLFVSAADTVSVSSGSESRTVAPGSIGLLPSLPGLNTGASSLTTSLPASVIAIIPGLLIDIIPKTMFSGCYLVHTIVQSQARALIIVETAQKGSVMIGAAPLTGASFNDSSASGYSWTIYSLSNCKSCVIWHPTSRIAVYVFENSASGVTFGGPAISVNDEPDPNGCVVVPVPYELSNNTMSWQQSRSHCTSKGMVLASPNLNFTQNKMAATLNNMNVEGFAWLGLRRNLMTSEWLWQTSTSFTFANWDSNNNQPAGGLCVSMIMEPSGNFTWSTVRCCSPMLPLCAGEMVVLSTVNDWS
ncbi:hypothetical protein C0J45_18118 [Silurus meridionalis]|nr:hypothetical protein C0J45_18118 [Silurus meridionalis]